MKIIILTFGICIFSLKPLAPHNIQRTEDDNEIAPKLHDFYLLRSITQKDESATTVIIIPSDDNDVSSRYYSDISIPKIILSTILKFHFLLSGTRWFAHARVIMDKWIEDMKINKRHHKADIHELTLCAIMVCIVIAIITSSRYMHAQDNAHAIGGVWSILGTIVATVGITIIYLLNKYLSGDANDTKKR